MSDIRVRFCPSPTGTPHVGMVRTCLFNWAFAKHTKGTFVFRIEDTDAQRDSEESYQQILDSLRWLGLDWDEGIDVGGPHGPYRQSQRMDIYKEVAQKLQDAGFAYESFSTPEEIAARNVAAGRPKQMGYDGYDRTLTAEQIAAFKAEGREAVVRLKMPDTDITFNDIIRGEVTFKAGTVPDYAIVRGNGQPLYTLVNPVDDALMEINTVLRGEDLLSSTPRQIALFDALKAIGVAKFAPSYGHLPYVMGEGNRKLSKRDPESNLLLHKENGIIPEGMVNYLALLGWSFAADEDIFTPQQLIDKFDPADVLANPAKFDAKKLTAINAEHIRLLDEDDFKRRIVPFLFGPIVPGLQVPDVEKSTKDELVLKPYPARKKLVSADSFDELTAREQEILTDAAPLIQERIQVLSQAHGMLGFLFVDDADLIIDEDAADQVAKVQNADEVIATAVKVLADIPDADWNTQTLHETLNTALTDPETGLGIKPRDAFTPLRVAISGRRVSPPLFESMSILGKQSTLNRLLTK